MRSRYSLCASDLLLCVDWRRGEGASLEYGRLVPLPLSLARVLCPVIGLAALPIMFVGCRKAPAFTEPLVRCAAGTKAPVELELEQALPVDGGVGFQPSGLYLSSGRLLMVSDKHDDAVFELSLQSDRAVARPFVTFHAPGGETLDLEGLTGGEGGSLLLASEAQFRILAVSPSGKATWSTPSLEKAGQEQGLFQKRNAGIEGVAKMGTQLVIAAEREPRGLLEATDGSVGKVLAYRLPRAACSARVGRPDDIADLSVAGGELYALERNAHLVVRLTRVDGRFREAGSWSYAGTENDARYRYPDRAFGLAEGLALDEEHVYIVLDNNGQPRESAKDDHRAVLFVFQRPR